MSFTPSQNDSPPTEPSAQPGELDVVIIGAGLSGLSCASLLCQHSKQSGDGSPMPRIAVLEATDRVGGRVRTDRVDGLTLDHGFQVLLTAYPACQRLLDYEGLRLRAFEPGALIRNRGRFTTLGDPWRRPSQAIATAMNPVGTLSDKLRVAKTKSGSLRGTLDDLYSRPHTSTMERLKGDGFSSTMIEQFFQPFLGGVFLDESLAMSSRMFEFVFRMFASGDIAIPADGMGAIPRQLAESLPRGTLRLRSTVLGIEHQSQGSVIHLSDGTSLFAKQLVIATESNAAARLLNRPELETQWNSTTTLYYSGKSSPDTRKMLMLRGDEEGPIQTAVVLSDVAPEYASAKRALLSVSISDELKDRDTMELDSKTRSQLQTWFGNQVSDWELVQTFRIPYGLPKTDLDPVIGEVAASHFADSDLPEHVFVCGDHRETPSIQGAMNSGIRVAEKIASTIS